MIGRVLRTAVLGLCLFAMPMIHAAAAAEAKIVAQVGTVPITVYDLGREQQRLLPFNASFHSTVPPETLAKMKEEALNTVIEQAYKVNYALDEKISIDKKALDERIELLRKKFKTDKEFKKALGDEDIKQVRLAIERSLLANKAEELAITKNIKVSDADVRAYYEANKQTYNRPKQYKASHILIKVNPASNKEERVALEKKASDLAKRAKANEDFYNLAYYNSDDRSKYVGGDIGYFHEGQTVLEFEDALKTMKPGEIAGPIKSMYGWHIIKLVELNEARQLEFDDVKARIREKLEKDARETLYANWMNSLKSKYPVKKF